MSPPGLPCRDIPFVFGGFLILVIGAMAGEPSARSTSWFDTELREEAVPIEARDSCDNFKTCGTGFFVRNYADISRPILVTCKHLVEGLRQNGYRELYVDVTADSDLIRQASKSSVFTLTFGGRSTWILYGERLRLPIYLAENHSYVTDSLFDIAALPVDLKNRGSLESGFREFARSRDVGRSMTVEAKDLEPGTDVFFLGYPLSFGEGERSLNPLVRSGTLAWISSKRDTFLLDAISWSGNSGSPVFTKSTSSKPGGYLIGMVVGHESLPQTITVAGIPVAVDLNYGLAVCLPMDRILTLVDRAARLGP